jgi:hypothetical protein
MTNTNHQYRLIYESMVLVQCNIIYKLLCMISQAIIHWKDYFSYTSLKGLRSLRSLNRFIVRVWKFFVVWTSKLLSYEIQASSNLSDSLFSDLVDAAGSSGSNGWANSACNSYCPVNIAWLSDKLKPMRPYTIDMIVTRLFFRRGRLIMRVQHSKKLWEWSIYFRPAELA